MSHALRGLPKKVDPNWQSEKQSWRKVRYGVESPFFDKVVNHIPSGVGHEEGLNNLTKNMVSGFFGTRHSIDVEARYDKLLPG